MPATASICDELQWHPGSSRPSEAAALGLPLTGSGQLSPPPLCPVPAPEGWLVGKALGERAQLGRKEQRGICEGGCERPGPEPACDRPKPCQREQLASGPPPSAASPRAGPLPHPALPLSASLGAHTHTAQAHTHAHVCTHRHILPPSPLPLPHSPSCSPPPLPQLGLIEQ